MSFDDLHTRQVSRCKRDLLWSVRRLSVSRCKRDLLKACAIAGLLFLSLSSGCVKGTPTPEPVTITFAHLSLDEDHYAALVQEFNERYPYVTVELKPIQPRDWWRGQRGPDEVDVFTTFDGALSELQKQGSILELDAFVEQDMSFELADFYPGTIEHLTVEGKTWAVPAGLDITVMFYNQDLFDRYDVPYPEAGWTWDDFMNIVLALRDPQANVFGYASPDLVLDALLFIYEHGGRIADDLKNPSRITFNDLENIEALEWYFKLMHEYDAIPTPDEERTFGGNRQGHVYYGFAQGKVGMWTGAFSQWGGRYWPTEWDMRWGIVPLPRDVRAVTVCSVEGYFISAQTEHPRACWQWIAFLSRQMPERLVPARKSLVESEAYEQRVSSGIVVAVRQSVEGELLMAPTNAPEELTQAFEAFGEAIEEVANERSTPLEAMEWAQQGLASP